jgi:hypothetical protein
MVTSSGYRVHANRERQLANFVLLTNIRNLHRQPSERGDFLAKQVKRYKCGPLNSTKITNTAFA